ncbi:DUF2591 domain-containing protein [Klebsiella sp. Ap-873]|nr:DUF2591 domain-containing protein [Klebsiella sp. Ap-873]
MTDYSQMSDFEINKRVAICIGFSPDECDIAKRGTSLVGVEWNEDTGYATKTVDYCNNPADAWPIILNEKIGLKPVRWEDWRAEGDDSCGFVSYASSNNNPLRAAMIVFLMMQDPSNANPI